MGIFQPLFMGSLAPIMTTVTEVVTNLDNNLTDIMFLRGDGLYLAFNDDNYYAVYDPELENQDINEFILNNPGVSLLNHSSDFSTLLGSQLASTNSLKHILWDTKSKKRMIIAEYGYSIECNKKSETIVDSQNKEIQFYLYEHDKNEKRPVAIIVHGGPFARFDMRSFNEEAQILYVLGFNVIELNYHGSVGMGNSYHQKAIPNLPRAAIENVETLLKWLHSQPNMDTNKVVLLGHSWGGYLTMLAKMALKDQITVAVALVPSSIENVLQYDVLAYNEVKLHPEKYDNWELSKTTNEKIGIIYNPYDEVIDRNRDWVQIERQNKNIKILKMTHTGHRVMLNDFKAALYYINDSIPFPGFLTP